MAFSGWFGSKTHTLNDHKPTSSSSMNDDHTVEHDDDDEDKGVKIGLYLPALTIIYIIY